MVSRSRVCAIVLSVSFRKQPLFSREHPLGACQAAVMPALGESRESGYSPKANSP